MININEDYRERPNDAFSPYIKLNTLINYKSFTNGCVEFMMMHMICYQTVKKANILLSLEINHLTNLQPLMIHLTK